jgi:hypothetical protein
MICINRQVPFILERSCGMLGGMMVCWPFTRMMVPGMLARRVIMLRQDPKQSLQ